MQRQLINGKGFGEALWMHHDQTTGARQICGEYSAQLMILLSCLVGDFDHCMEQVTRAVMREDCDTGSLC